MLLNIHIFIYLFIIFKVIFYSYTTMAIKITHLLLASYWYRGTLLYKHMCCS